MTACDGSKIHFSRLARKVGDFADNCCKSSADQEKHTMETPYDWSTVIVFAGLIVLFLQRSQGEARDHLWQYLVASIGCAVTNYIGNEAIKLADTTYHLGAVAIGIATLAFIWIVLRPFQDE
jgi:hypothetical protein